MRSFILLLGLALASCSDARQSLSVSRNVTPGFEDTAPHSWIGRSPRHYPVHGIDVSKYQGKIDWRGVKAAGASFAFIKATEGGDLMDARFAENWEGARRAGLPRGAYHFFYLCRPAIEQAEWFIAHVPKEETALPPVLDLEWNHRSPTCRLRPHPSALRREIGVFLARIAAHYGQRPIIYSTPDFFRENDLSRMEGYDFWLRSVAAHPSSAYPGQPWTFWQYTGTGIIPGVDGPTDINVFFGPPSKWREWIAGMERGHGMAAAPS